MTRIAWLSVETPGRNGGGGRRRQFHQLRVLVEHGIDVEAATLASSQDDLSLSALCPVTRIRPARRRERISPNRDLLGFLTRGRFDGAVVAHVESVGFARRSLAAAGLPWLLDFHNVYSRWCAANGNAAGARRWQRLETAAVRAATVATACSAEEAAALGGRAAVAGHGVDADEWPDDALAKRREPALVLAGAWSHQPNRDGALWLTERVWPAVVAAVPEARLLLAGPDRPPDECLATPGVEALGRVPDLAALLGRALVAVVPIVRGVGARVKFGEALASGAAVVSTSEGAEGFDADSAFRRADDPETFARECIELLHHPERAHELGRLGRAIALDRLRWERTSESILAFAKLGRG
jgi:glycosyltransferase involved in cell wall biosynthesis